MQMEPVTVLSASSSVPVGFDYRGGEFGELVVVYNPSTNSNTVFLSLNRDATTAAVTGQVAVAPGQYAFFILTQKDNRTGINAIAATGNTVVTVQRQSFRSDLERLAVMGGLYGGAVAGQYWVAISGTQIKLAGAYTEARADKISSKTQAGAGGFLDLSSATQVALVSPNGNTYRVVKDGSLEDTISSTARQTLDATGLNLFNSTPVIIFAGASDQRAFIDAVGLVASTPTAGGVIDSSGFDMKFPIKNGAVIAAGDLVEFQPNTDNRVQSAAAASVNTQVGFCITGGTGNAGGTVFARVKLIGIVTSLLADTGGITADQYSKPGLNTANRVISTAAIAVNSHGRALKTAIAGAATTIMFQNI